jgi:predicted nucleic-acid-binding protein
MKALDTNVLVRYLVQDDPAQSRRAATYIESAAATGEQILIGNIVLCETVWVLDSAYGYSKREIEGAIEKLLQSSTFQFEAKDMIHSAFDDYRSGRFDFADCLIGRIHALSGCEPTATFDAAIRRLSTFQII